MSWLIAVNQVFDALFITVHAATWCSDQTRASKIDGEEKGCKMWFL